MAVYSGYLTLYHNSDAKEIQEKNIVVEIYRAAFYMVEGLLAAALLLIFWALRYAHDSGQVNSSNQLLLSDQCIFIGMIIRQSKSKIFKSLLHKECADNNSRSCNLLYLLRGVFTKNTRTQSCG